MNGRTKENENMNGDDRMTHIENHNRLIASHKDGIFHVRVDYMADCDAVQFHVNGTDGFIVRKRLVSKGRDSLIYDISIENIGEHDILTPIELYSSHDGVFTEHQIFEKNIVGTSWRVKSLKIGKKRSTMFLVRLIEDREEALFLIRDLTEQTIYGRKVLSIFERFDEDLRGDVELFLEGMKHSPHVWHYASEELKSELRRKLADYEKTVKLNR